MASTELEIYKADVRPSPFGNHGYLPVKEKAREDSEEESCSAFGYLRGVRDRAFAIEMRLRNGNSEWFPYSLLGPWRFNPSVGLLLRFSGEVTSLVLICGSNLAATVHGGATNLTDRGIQRHRITWIREMDEAELRSVGENGPTIDRIEIGEAESNDEVRQWIESHAPHFVR